MSELRLEARPAKDNSGSSRDVLRMVQVVEISHWELGVGKDKLNR